MTEHTKTGSLSEHAAAIRAALRAAVDAGFRVEFEVNRDPWNYSTIESIDLDLNEWGSGYETVWSEEW
jgi:hypothetical protein